MKNFFLHRTFCHDKLRKILRHEDVLSLPENTSYFLKRRKIMAKNTIWITGASGKLGIALIDQLQKNVNNKIIGTDLDVDITDSQTVNHAVNMYRPTIIINCHSISN